MLSSNDRKEAGARGGVAAVGLKLNDLVQRLQTAYHLTDTGEIQRCSRQVPANTAQCTSTCRR